MSNNVLRVGVSNEIMLFPSMIGVGKVWNRTLRRLIAAGTEVHLLEPGSWRAKAVRPDVWLFDGHLGAISVDRPSVAVLQEAPWRDPVLAGMLSPAWVRRLGVPSEESARRATLILAPSESSARQITESAGVDRNQVRTVPYGVDPQLFHPNRKKAGKALVRRNGGSDQPYVLAVSTVLPRKNVEALRGAMKTLADAGFPHQLALVLSPSPDATDGTDRDAAIHAQLEGYPGRVVVLKDLSEIDLAAVMSAASAYCQPSLMEGFGLTTLESMACGAPVVVSDRGSLPEVVGEAGIVVEPTSAAFAEALARLLGDPRLATALGTAGLARSLQFTWDATARGWLEALEEAASLHPGGRRAAVARRG